ENLTSASGIRLERPVSRISSGHPLTRPATERRMPRIFYVSKTLDGVDEGGSVKRSKRLFRLAAALVVLALTAVAPIALAGGFAINEKGSKATAMGGAFAAFADDPSAMYYNPAGLGGNDKLTVMVGVTLIPYFSKLEGANPYPGDGYNVEMK